MSTNYTATNGNDTFDGRDDEFDGEYTNIDLLDGDDTAYLAHFQTFVSGPGNDTIIGSYEEGYGYGYALWHASEPVYVNLEEGYAQDGFGGVDTLSGIGTVHL